MSTRADTAITLPTLQIAALRRPSVTGIMALICLILLADSMKVVGLGLAIGLALALVAGRAVESFLGDVSFAAPIALVAGPLVMIACALVASWLPARHAARMDPITALREE